VYIPTQVQWEVASRAADGQFKYVKGRTTIGSGVNNYPDLRRELNQKAATSEQGYLLAWDPVHQKEAFRVTYRLPGNGGTLVTAGNILVQGTIDKTLAIYRATDGKKLWEMPVGTVPVSGPMTFAIGDTQYIAINAGWNSAIVAGLNSGPEPFSVGPARLIVFKLDAKGVELPPAPASTKIPPPPTDKQPRDAVLVGGEIYAQMCRTCHGANATGGVVDLRYLTPEQHAGFMDTVLKGTHKTKGMASFRDLLTDEQAASIHSYLINRAQEDWQPMIGPPPKQR